MKESLKQVMVVRHDLGMSVGKTASQVAHASLSAYRRCRETNPRWARGWIRQSQPKIVCRVDSEDELKDIERSARNRGVPSYTVQDKGLTEVLPGTITCIGLGPAPISVIDPITEELRLLR